MFRLLVAFVVTWVFCGGKSSAAVFSEADLIGIWQVKPSTYVVFPNMGNNSGVIRIVQRDGTELVWHDGAFVATLPESMPTNFTNLTLVLRKDGSFAATNVPAGFFFDGPTTYAEGAWELRTLKVEVLLSGATRQRQELVLHFSRPSPLQWYDDVFEYSRPYSGRPGLHVFVGNHRQVCLIKEGASRRPDEASNPVLEQNKNGEPTASANRSQPVHSETNRTSAAAGSGR